MFEMKLSNSAVVSFSLPSVPLVMMPRPWRNPSTAGFMRSAMRKFSIMAAADSAPWPVCPKAYWSACRFWIVVPARWLE